jgi:hypothetical protein
METIGMNVIRTKQQAGILAMPPAIINYAAASIAKHASILIPGCGNAYEAKAL